jgi:hypothetical protein
MKQTKINLDYEDISVQAFHMNISPYILVKRKLHYRKCNDESKSCGWCSNRSPMKYDEKIRQQCSVVGEGKDFRSDIDLFFTCVLFSAYAE